MTANTHKYKFLPLSIISYGVIITLFGLCLFGAFGWFALHEMSNLREKTDKRLHLLAREEIHHTLKEILNRSQDLAKAFSNWEETSQQFVDSTYFTYWRDNRVHQTSFTPNFFVNIALYKTNGELLTPTNDSDLPDTLLLPVKNGTYYLKNIGNKDYLIYLHSVKDEQTQTLIGYQALQIDFNKALRAIQRFKHTAPNSIEVNYGRKTQISGTELINAVSFHILPNPEFEKLNDLMIRTLYGFATLGVILAGVFLYVLFALFGLPSRRLSRQIDALRDGKYKFTDTHNVSKFSIAELEKVRTSLNSYQLQLDQQSAALKENELYMRTIMENVVDGIFTIDAQGTIASYNRAAQFVFGLSRDTAKGKQFLNLIAPKSHNEYYAYSGRYTYDNWQPGEPKTCELTGIHSDGSEFPVEIAMTEMELQGNKLFIIVARDITERKQAEAKLLYLANYDELTGLPNRTLFKDRLLQAILRANRMELLAAVVFLDLDQFKKINDTLGHHLGDVLLKNAAKRIQTCIREIDTLARFGGDEFVIILENIHHVDELHIIVSKLLHILEDPFVLDGHEVFVAASAGITIYPFDDTEPDNLVKNADSAMFVAKDNGGNTYEFFTASINEQAVEKMSIENALRYALDRKEFRLCYQPRVDLHTGRIIGMEALLRWHHPQMGVILPDRFIPILEETGLIIAVGEWVLKSACEQTRIWNELFNMELRLSVNISARQFRQKTLARSFGKILQQTGLAPNHLELELTEGLLIENFHAAVEILRLFNDMGIHVSIDDFGTGYSSMAYLKRLPIDTLKIDRSFLKDVTYHAEDAAITTAIVALARSLDLRVTAEGVETEDQLNFIKNLNCDEAQGFYFSKPVSADIFETYLARQQPHGRFSGEFQPGDYRKLDSGNTLFRSKSD